MIGFHTTCDINNTPRVLVTSGGSLIEQDNLHKNDRICMNNIFEIEIS